MCRACGGSEQGCRTARTRCAAADVLAGSALGVAFLEGIWTVRGSAAFHNLRLDTEGDGTHHINHCTIFSVRGNSMARSRFGIIKTKSNSPEVKDKEILTGLCPSKRPLQGLNGLSG